MESGNKLAAALSKAQGAIKSAKKTAENTFFSKDNKKSMYAKIEDVIEAIQVPASSNGLSVIFNYKSEITESKVWHFIKYLIRHESGECFESEWLAMLLKDGTQHSFGSSNTYYRRQLLKAIYQIPEEDDDGNSQSIPPETKTLFKDTKKPIQKKNNDLMITFGTFKGNLFSEIKINDLKGLYKFLKDSSKGSTPTQEKLNFMASLESFIREAEKTIK